MASVRGRSPFLERVREAIRIRHYSLYTERAYVYWARRYIFFHGKRHPEQMAETEVAAFLSHLAVQRKVAAATQNQALNALVFMYKAVLDRPLGEIPGVVRAKKPVRLPVVLSRVEVAALLSQLHGVYWLMGCLLYGSGLRLRETLTLRVKDIEFNHRAIVVRDGKGMKDRVVTLADTVIVPLQRHLEDRRTIYERDLDAGVAAVWLPFALARKYPSAPRSWGWQYIFPASRPGKDPRTGIIRRHHIHRVQCRKRFTVLFSLRESKRWPLAILCAIPLRRICWSGVQTFAQYKNNSVIVIYARLKFTPMCYSEVVKPCVALWMDWQNDNVYIYTH